MNCVLSGVGGQGTVLASRIIAQAALDADLPVRTAETIGMSQRGGSVVTHVRVGATPDDEVASPLVPRGQADIIIAFEPGEATRVLDYLAPDGILIVADSAIIPPSASLSKETCYSPMSHLHYQQERLGERCTVIETGLVVERCGSVKPVNITLLGAAGESGKLGFSLVQLKSALASRVKPAFLDMNIAAIDLGAEVYQTSAGRWHG